MLRLLLNTVPIFTRPFDCLRSETREDLTMTYEDYPFEMRHLVERVAPGWPPFLDVGPGWYPLLTRLDNALSTIAPGYVLHQCKSKFGSLSFHAAPSEDPNDYRDDFNAAILAAEWESVETCEEYGAAGGQYTINLWVSTLCAAHAAIRHGDANSTANISDK